MATKNTKSKTTQRKTVGKSTVKEIVKENLNETFDSADIEALDARSVIELASQNLIEDDEEDEKLDDIKVDTPVGKKDKEKETSESREDVRKLVEQQKPQKVYDQHDLILCRNLSAGWLKMVGKSGIPYVWNATGDLCEVEYGDLWARKTAKSQYLYEPYILIEDEELLSQPRWKDLKQFYDEKVYGLDNINAIINVPASSLKKVLVELSNGMKKAVAVRAAVMVENGELDSLKKIKIIDEVCGTDIMSVLPN